MKNTISRRFFLERTTLVTTGIALLSSNSALNALTEDASPFKGYNPYAEEKTDLRTSIFGEHVRIKGTVYDDKGVLPRPNATVEVWHLSPNSTKYRHQAKIKTNANGEFDFITDFPNRELAKSAKIYFKITHNSTSFFTELAVDQSGANITSKHWQENRLLGDKLLPKANKSLNTLNINFNISI